MLHAWAHISAGTLHQLGHKKYLRRTLVPVELLHSVRRAPRLQVVRLGAKAAGDSLAESRALWQTGAALTEAGSWREAQPPLTQSLALLEAIVGSFHLDIARVCNSLAIVYYKVKRSLHRCAARHEVPGGGNLSCHSCLARSTLQEA